MTRRGPRCVLPQGRCVSHHCRSASPTLADCAWHPAPPDLVRVCPAACFAELGWYGNWTCRCVEPAKGVDMSEANPYVEARREWNDRYLELVRERRWGQIVAGTELALSLILAGGLISVSGKQKTVPYAVEVDSLGAALAINPAENVGS